MRRRLERGTYTDIVFQLYSSGRVEFDILQGLSHDIVRLPLALLRGLDRGGLVDVALVVDVELAEGVGEAEDLVLLELRILPAERRRGQLRGTCERPAQWAATSVT